MMRLPRSRGEGPLFALDGWSAHLRPRVKGPARRRVTATRGRSLQRALRQLLPLLAAALTLPCGAAQYRLPYPEFDLVGVPVTVRARAQDTLVDIARRHGIGQEAIRLANPEVDPWLPGAGTPVVIPSHFILPPFPHEGLILNLPEMRLYYYPEADAGEEPRVYTYAVSIGRMDWATPLGVTRLVSKERDPAWRPPESIRREHAADGDPLPAYVPPGPDNPLGRHALRLAIPGYLIHGTNKEFGLGMRASHGCIRMQNEDIAELFEMVPPGTQVRIVNEPVKVGWHGGDLYLEVHPPLEEHEPAAARLYPDVLDRVDRELFEHPVVELDEEALEGALARPTGLPVVISRQP